jgi:hypothetical protein
MTADEEARLFGEAAAVVEVVAGLVVAQAALDADIAALLFAGLADEVDDAANWWPGLKPNRRAPLPGDRASRRSSRNCPV